MNKKFDKHIRLVVKHYENLISGPVNNLKDRSKFKNIPGIYILIENDSPVYVGRTRNLRNRLQAHISASHNSASFAVKRMRANLSLVPTYKLEMSREFITKTEPYRGHFLEEIEKIREM